MKLLIILSILLFASPCLAGSILMVGGGTPSGPSYLLSEDFASTNACFAAASCPSNDCTCTNLWTKSGAGDYHAADLGGGGYAWNSTAATGYAFINLPSSYDTIHVFFYFKPVTLADVDTIFFYIGDTDWAHSVMLAEYRGTHEMRLTCGSIPSDDSIGTFSAGTTYHIELRYTKQSGGGNNGVCEMINYTTSETITETAGNGDYQAGNISTANPSVNSNHTIDHIRVLATTIGDN